MTLVEFLRENPIDNVTEEVIISERLKDFKFKIKAMTNKEYSKHNNECTIISKNKKIAIDSNELTKRIILNSCIEPNFKLATDIELAGCIAPDDYLEKCLNAGEQQILASKIMELSGVGQSFDDIREEVKN